MAAGQAKKSSFKTAALLTLLSFTIVAAIARYILEPQDRDRCHGMLNKGKWVSKSDEKWEPSGCMTKAYRDKDIKSCLEKTRILYIGDSIMREQFYSMTKLSMPMKQQMNVHIDQKFVSKDKKLTVEMWWDPYLNETKTLDFLSGKMEDDRPSLLVIGSGVWHMRRLDNDYLEEWKMATDRVFNAAQNHHIADKMLLSPVEVVTHELLTPERKETITFDKITITNNYLRERERNLPLLKTPLRIPFVWNEMVTSSTKQTKDGLHFLSKVTTAQAQIALNYRCNEQLDKSFPVVNTCCSTYMEPQWYQKVIFFYFLCFVPLGFYVLQASSGIISKYIGRLYPSSIHSLLAFFVFGLSVAYMYMGDRTHVFGKMAKQFDPVTFAGLNAAALFVGLMTLKFKDSSSDAGFLNRDQTDEWKGWMQLAILIYHFVGASRTAGIYNPVRVLVAAYLFQTGYGHFHFFYKKADFGIARVLNIMVRLNLLTCILAYSMNTNYLFYYFSPLCSFWFAVIWICMRVGYRYNDRAWFILTKIVISGIATGAIIHYPGILETVFDLLSWAFKIDWDVVDWRFRLGLDAWIVYIGMICAYVSIRLTQAKVTSTYPTMWKAVEHISVALSVIGLYWFFSFELTLSKASYSSYHPYISWIPILSFVCLRNCTVFLRNTHSRFFALIGKMSLETYIGQFHMWLAADTQGLLVVIPSASYAIQSSFGWYLNLGLSSLIFFCVCHHLSKATGTITRVVCSGVSEQKSKDTYLQLPIHELPVPLLPTSTQTEQQEITVADETHVLIEESKSLDESSIIYEDSRPKAKWYSLLVNNYWIRSLLMLTLLGIINRFCS